MQIITTAIIKGGTAKTATAAALLQAAVKDNKRALAIDLDPQANLTYSLGANQNQAGAYDMIESGLRAAEVIQTTVQGINVIAAAPDLATLRTTPGSAKRLAASLEPIKNDYDLIIIDTPPTLGELLFNALQASTGLLVPLEADNNSLQGLYQITDLAHQMQQSNPELTVKGAVLTRYDSRPKLNRYLHDAIAEAGQEIGTPLIGEIRPGIVVKEAAALQQNLFDYAGSSKPAADYLELYKKLMEV